MQRNCTQIKKWEIAEFIFIAIVGTLLHFVYDTQARQAIKYLVADGRYDYIETGSLISIKKNVENILIPL